MNKTNTPQSVEEYGIYLEIGNPLPVGSQELRVTSFLNVIDLRHWDFHPSPKPL